MVVFDQGLDSIILEVFSSLNYSIILCVIIFSDDGYISLKNFIASLKTPLFENSVSKLKKIIASFSTYYKKFESVTINYGNCKMLTNVF